MGGSALSQSILNDVRWSRVVLLGLVIGIPTCGVALAWTLFRLKSEARLVQAHRESGYQLLGAEDWDRMVFF